MDNGKLEKTLAKALGRSGTGKAYLFVCASESYDPARTFIIDNLAKGNKKKLVVVSLAKRGKALEAELKKNNTDTRKIFFLDGSGENGPQQPSSNFAYVEGPGALTHLSMVLTKLTASGEYHAIVVDSVSAMLRNRDAQTVEKFADYLVRKLRALNIDDSFIVLDEKHDGPAIEIMAQLCDYVVRV